MAKTEGETATEKQGEAGTALATTAQEGANLPATTAQQAFVQAILDAAKREFEEANAGMGLDYVRMGDFIKLDKMGQIVEHGEGGAVFGRNLDVVIAKGEQKFMLWGKDKSPEKGQLIVVADTQEQAEANLENWIMEDQARGERYSVEDIQLRYLAYMVPVADIQPDEIPQIYMTTLSPSDTLGWGRYSRDVFNGKKYTALGIPKKCGVNRVVTRLGSEMRENQDGETYVGWTFTPVGLFIPSEYGITE